MKWASEAKAGRAPLLSCAHVFQRSPQLNLSPTANHGSYQMAHDDGTWGNRSSWTRTLAVPGQRRGLRPRLLLAADQPANQCRGAETWTRSGDFKGHRHVAAAEQKEPWSCFMVAMEELARCLEKEEEWYAPGRKKKKEPTVKQLGLSMSPRSIPSIYQWDNHENSSVLYPTPLALKAFFLT